MATPQEKLAESLEALHALQGRGVVAIRSADLSRTHRERLLANGFLKEVIKGWYIASRPDETPGDSTPFCAKSPSTMVANAAKSRSSGAPPAANPRYPPTMLMPDFGRIEAFRSSKLTPLPWSGR